MTSAGLSHAFEHHVWATLRLLDACSGLTTQQLEAPVPGIYGGVLDTLRHIVGADAWYLFVLTGGRVARIDEETMDLAEIRAEVQGHAAAWREVLSDDRAPDEDVVARRGDGTEGHASLGVRLAQALHHGTDHRSQVCTALTTLGTEPPEIDVWAYGEQAGSVWDASGKPA